MVVRSLCCCRVMAIISRALPQHSSSCAANVSPQRLTSSLHFLVSHLLWKESFDKKQDQRTVPTAWRLMWLKDTFAWMRIRVHKFLWDEITSVHSALFSHPAVYWCVPFSRPPHRHNSTANYSLCGHLWNWAERQDAPSQCQHSATQSFCLNAA